MNKRMVADPPAGLRRTARRLLSRRLGRGPARMLLGEADREYPAVAVHIPSAGRGAEHLLRMSAYVVALHRGLINHGLDTDAADGLIADAVYETILPARDTLQRIARLRHRNRLRRLRWASKIACRFYYGEPDWQMTDVDVADGVGMDITRCVVAEFFASLGMSDLCERAICDQDRRTAEHHGVRFVRAGTLAGGADRCDFRYHLPLADDQVDVP